MTILKYGNTRTFFLNGLLIDTDCAGTLPAFFRAIGEKGVRLKDIAYVMTTHCHPDHMGLVGELTARGVKYLLIDVQKDFLHFPDRIFARDGLRYVPPDARAATVVSCAESRAFLARLGISGEIVPTPSHSPDSVALVTDGGDCFAGDLAPHNWIGAFGDDAALEADWARLLALHPRRVFFAHAPERIIE